MNKKDRISQYIFAKDSNKIHLMKNVFSNTAVLNIKLDSDKISFPSLTEGLINISKVLVSDFNKTYENIYTFCLEDSIIEDNNSLTCKWFVLMSEKNTDKTRIAYGSYLWEFNENNFVKKLNIRIEEMIILDKEDELFDLFSKLSYPYCNSLDILKNLPKLDALDYLSKKIKKG